MIGNFHYADRFDEGAVNVRMEWRDGERGGRLILAPALEAALATGNYPALGSSDLSLESAVSYALFIAMQAQVPLILTGDSSVWDPRWGELLVAYAANEQPAMQRGSARH